MNAIEIKAALTDIQNELDQSDKTLVRYLEDMLLLLLRKGIFDKSEVPEIVLDRIIRRQSLREEMSKLTKILYNMSAGD